MKKLSLLFLLILFPFLFIQAQNFTINGQLTDQSNQPTVFANVILLQPSDSSLITGATSDLDGNFKIENVLPGKFILKISYIGYDDVFLNKEVTNESLLLSKLVLKEKATKLKEVTVVSAMTPVLQIGDTTQINAGAFKTNPDANAEDLVTKMPGITLLDGKVQAQGENVQKVLVDGKEFFGDDANAVLKNLPAEVIDKIQIFDKKSEQSQLTGFDDGNTSKTINIITKPQFKNGTFGKVFGGYGYEDKWKAGLNLNIFKNKERITILANTNNINDQNFSSEDLLGVMSSSGGGNKGGGSGRMGGQGKPDGQSNDANNFLVDQKNGITTTHSFGINYANQWKKVDFTGSYFINYSDNNSTNNLFRQYITSRNEGLSYKENSERNSSNVNHRASFKVDWKIDSLNSVLFQPKISVQKNDGSSSLFGENMQSSSVLSNTSNGYKSNLTGINVSSSILYRHQFNKKGRTFSLNITPGYNQNNGNSNLNSTTHFFADTLSEDSLNQLANLYVQGLSFSSNMVYTEPLNVNSQLMFSYGTNFNLSESDKATYNFSGGDDSYNSLDTALSNKFNSEYQSHSFGTSYRYQKGKLNFNTGLSYQYAQLKAEQVFPNSFGLDKTFNSILPNARFQYKFSSKKSLRIFYRSSNNAPSVNQLQNVINNNNPLQLTSGNPDLKQDWQNALTLRYSSSNTEKSRSFFLLLSGTYTKNYIVNNTFIASGDTLIAPGIILTSGSQLSRPDNQDGYFNVRSFNNYSFPVSKIKSNLNFNVGGMYSRTPGIVNNKLNYANSSNVGFGLALSSNISEKFDFTLSSNTTYNTNSNTLQANLNSIYYNQNTKFKIQVMPWKSLVLQTDLSHQYNSGLSANFNQNYLLWNAAIGYKFLKNNQGELRLSVFDILKQNNSITRNITETYYEDVQTNVLQQYFLLTFTYNIKQFKEAKPKE
ncbi:MAG: outer membrane beta-barrel protein [Bacteroidota bacterium]